MGIGTENGHFYARGLLEALDIEPADGVVRISLVHYNSLDEVRHIVESLDNVLL